VAEGNLVMLVILVLAILGGNNLVAAAAGILLVLDFTSLRSVFPILERRALDVGLLFLVIAILMPFATGEFSLRDVVGKVGTLYGLTALAGGAIAAYLSGRGLDLLRHHPQVMVGLIIGTLVGVAFLKGIPVGPLNAAGFAAVILRMLDRMR